MASSFDLSKSNILSSLNCDSVCSLYFLNNIFLAVFASTGFNWFDISSVCTTPD